MAICPKCTKKIRPVIDPGATPEGGGIGISSVTWICPECEVILGVSEVDLL